MIRDDINRLVHADTFASEDSLVDAEAAGRDRDDSAVGWDLVSDRDSDDVSWDDFRSVNTCNLTIAQDLGFVWGVLLQSLLMQ